MKNYFEVTSEIKHLGIDIKHLVINIDVYDNYVLNNRFDDI